MFINKLTQSAIKIHSILIYRYNLFMSMRKNKHQIGFAIDIDGTLVISGKPIP